MREWVWRSNSAGGACFGGLTAFSRAEGDETTPAASNAEVYRAQALTSTVLHAHLSDLSCLWGNGCVWSRWQRVDKVACRGMVAEGVRAGICYRSAAMKH